MTVTTIQDYAAARRLRDALALDIADLLAGGLTPSTQRIDLYTEYRQNVEALSTELRGWTA